MDILITAIVSPIIVILFNHYFMVWYNNRQKSEQEPYLNKIIRDIQKAADEPFKRMYKKPGDK